MSGARINRAPSATPAEGVTGQNSQHTNNLLIWTPPICPPLDQSLIDYLRAVFPLKLQRTQDLRDYDALRGQHELIAHLEGVFRQQNP